MVALVGMCLGLVGCATNIEADGDERWQDLDPASVTSSVKAAVYLSLDIHQPGNSDKGGTLAVVNHDGNARFFATGKLDNGKVAIGGDGTLSWASETTSYLVTPSAKRQVVRGGEQATGDEWSSAPIGGPQLFNSGASDRGYAMDVYAWTEAGQLRHTEVITTPGPSAVDGTVMYVTNSGDEEDRTLLKVVPGQPAQVVARWNQHHGGGWLVTGESQAVVSDGKFWFIDEVVQFDADDEAVVQPDGTKARGRLVSVDLKTGAFQARVFARYEGASREEARDGTVSDAAFAAFEAGHGRHTNRFDLVDRRGRICSVTIPSAKLSCRQRQLSKRALSSGQTLADWHDNRLWLLLYNDQVWLESYDLTTGQQLSAERLRDLEPFRKDNPARFAYDFAVRPGAQPGASE